jgi:hypothetical protein
LLASVGDTSGKGAELQAASPKASVTEDRDFMTRHPNNIDLVEKVALSPLARQPSPHGSGVQVGRILGLDD